MRVVLTKSVVLREVVWRVVIAKGVSSKVVVRLVNNHFGRPGSLLPLTDGDGRRNTTDARLSGRDALSLIKCPL